MKCPNCKDDELWRESVDIGVGIIYGPYGCESCGYSDDPQYDCSKGAKITKEGHILDQFGMLYPQRKII